MSLFRPQQQVFAQKAYLQRQSCAIGGKIDLNKRNHWNVYLRYEGKAERAPCLPYLLFAAAAAPAVAAGPPAWAGGGTAAPPGRRQRGRWLAEREEEQVSRGEAGSGCKLNPLLRATAFRRATFHLQTRLTAGDAFAYLSRHLARYTEPRVIYIL